MASGNVTTGHTGALASALGKKLGRRVVVHRVETPLRLPGGRQKLQIRYSLGIAGSHPPVFFNMTVNECKARMAMLLDLLHSGVINAVSDTDSGPNSGPSSPPKPSGGHDADPQGLLGGTQSDDPRFNVPPRDDDSY